MRNAFIEALLAEAERDERVWLVCGDLGYSVLEPFAARFPERYVNAGVAEQNLTGVAAGLALAGKTVFTYSIANFPVARCLEQIRNDVCYHGLNVKVVAVGGGLAYGHAGYSHFGLEDLALMRAMPGMTVFAPGDPAEARLVTAAAVSRPGPCYIRLGKAGEPVVHEAPPDFAVGRAIEVQPGRDLTVLATGGMLHAALAGVRRLAEAGVSARLLSMPTIKPLDEAAIAEAAAGTGALLTIEEHAAGGLGTAVAELIASEGLRVRFKALRLPEGGPTRGGSHFALRAPYGLSPEGIAEAATALLART
jgi:transketolase